MLNRRPVSLCLKKLAILALLLIKAKYIAFILKVKKTI